MPRTCTICRHERRSDIDADLIASRASLRDIASEYGTSVSALRRHGSTHLPAQLLRAKDAEERTHATSLLDQVETLQTRSAMILRKAEAAGDLRTALAALREMRGMLELLARVALRNGAVVEIAQVESYTENVIDVLYEYVPEDRFADAMARLVQLLEKEIAGERVLPARASSAGAASSQ